MNKQTQNDHAQMRHYLLGMNSGGTDSEGPEADGLEEFESRIFADDALYLALQEEQDALIDDFLSGQLTTGEAQRFREQSDRSAALRDKVEEFRALRNALEMRRSAAGSGAGVRSRRWNWWLTPAVAGVCLLCVFLLLHRGYRAVAPTTEQPESASQEAKSQGPAQAAAVLFLPYNVKRGAPDLPELNIPESASAIDLQLEINKTAGVGTRWKIELSRGSDRPLPVTDASAQRIGTETFVVAHLTATSLPDGRYTVRLTPSTSDQPVLTRSFLVKRLRVSR